MSATHQLLRFGLFELNLDTEELRKDGIPIKLGPQPFKVLAILTSRSGQLVTRDEIRQQVWGEDTYVDFDHGLNQCIKQIRTALNDNSSKPLYIETLPRKGYRFLAPVTSKTITVLPKVTASSSGVQPRVALPVMATALTDPAPVLPPAESVHHGLASPAEDVRRVAVPINLPVKQSPAEKPVPEPVTRSQRNRAIVWLSVAVVLVGAFAGGRYLYKRLRHQPVLTDRDSIVISDFDNRTGDSVFDETLRQGLWSALEQSPYLNIVSDERVARTMSLMTQPKGATLTPSLARQVCVRTGSAATLEGEISTIGSQYVLGLKAVNCTSGDELAVEQVTAESKEKVLSALGTAASRIRQRLGESLSSVEKYDAPLEDVTTPSLDALQAYSRARKAAAMYGGMAALPLYKRAVELDPNFAMAYVSLASLYANLNQTGRSSEDARKAYELRGKVSEKERLRIEAYYRLNTTGELEKAEQAYQLWQQAYPREYAPYGNLSFIYMELGNWQEALTQARGAIQIVPDSNIGYVNAAGAYLALNRLEEAEDAFKQAEGRGLWSEDMLAERYQLAFLKGDYVKLGQILASGEGQAGIESSLLDLQAETDAWFGKLNNARDRSQQAINTAESNDSKEAAAGYQAAAALREVELGDREKGKALAKAAVKLAPNRDVQAMAAMALARAGDTAGAENMAAALGTAFPLDTLVQEYWLPTIRAAVALQHKDAGKAIEILRSTNAIELSQPVPAKNNSFLYPAYLRAQAYLMLHDGNAAAAEFRKLIDHRGLVANNPLGALARLGLAQAYAEQGDTVKARDAYQEFLTIWKDADPNLVLYQQAKAQLSTLN